MKTRSTLSRRVVLPPHVAPMLAVLAPYPKDPENFAFEFKWDGYRALCYWDGARLRLESRNQLDITGKYPELLPLARQLGPKPALLDGEIVAFDDKRRPNFGLLQKRSGWNGEHRARPALNVNVDFIIFDLLYHKGRSVMHLPYVERRARLEKMELRGAHWNTPSYHPGVGTSLLDVAKIHGFEGVVAKRLTSVYRPGHRSGDWLKLKLMKRQEFVVGGWIPGQGTLTGSVGALLVGYYEDGLFPTLRYAGRVGTGFNDRDRSALAGFFNRIEQRESPFRDRVPHRQARFVEPIMVIEVAYFDITSDGKLRHPSFKGVRPDKRPDDVRLERENFG